MTKLLKLMFGTVFAALSCGTFWHNKSARWQGDQKGNDREQAADFEGLFPKHKQKDAVKRAN